MRLLWVSSEGRQRKAHWTYWTYWFIECALGVSPTHSSVCLTLWQEWQYWGDRHPKQWAIISPCVDSTLDYRQIQYKQWSNGCVDHLLPDVRDLTRLRWLTSQPVVDPYRGPLWPTNQCLWSYLVAGKSRKQLQIAFLGMLSSIYICYVNKWSPDHLTNWPTDQHNNWLVSTMWSLHLSSHLVDKRTEHHLSYLTYLYQTVEYCLQVADT